MKDLKNKISHALAGYHIDAYEIYYEQSRNIEVESRDGKLEFCEDAIGMGVGLRTQKNQRIGFSYSTDFSESGIASMVKAAVSVAEFVDPNPDVNFYEPKSSDVYRVLPKVDPAFATMQMDQRLKLANEVELAAKNSDPRIKTVRDASYGEHHHRVAIFNSFGLELESEQVYAAVSVNAVAEANDEAESGSEFDFSFKLSELNAEHVGKMAAKNALKYLGGVTPDTKTCPVVFSNEVSSQVLSVLISSFLGDNVFKKRSLLTDKIGQVYYSPLLQLSDDPTLDKATGRAVFDGVGAPKQKIALVENGIIKHLLCDLEYAKKLAQPATASSIRPRGFMGQTAVGQSNLVMQAGDQSVEQLQKLAGNGFYITDVMGLHLADSISGDFSVGAQGFEIINGELGRPVKNMAIAGNLHQMMREVLAIGNDARIFHSIVASSLLLKELVISGN